MAEQLLSVGLDVGTTTTQMVVSELEIENTAGALSVPEMAITKRRIIYKSDAYFTPLKGTDLVDAEALREIITEEYRRAGIDKSNVDTGAIIITGETSRKENARYVLEQMAGLAGDFVVATAGPDLESVLAAKGAGAEDLSCKTGMPVLHMDIGGGTSNLALIKDGRIIETGCLNIGGRLIKFDNLGKVRYVSPVICGLCDVSVGDTVTEKQVEAIVEMLVSVLEMAAGKRETGELLKKLTTVGTAVNIPQERVMLSFSGGVADCIEHDIPWLQYGDIGPILGKTIKNSRLCGDEYAIGEETIRATVIGAGCHSTTLSGSTVFYRNVSLPIKNMPAVCFSEYVRRDMERFEESVIIAVESQKVNNYDLINKLADEIVSICGNESIYVCTEQDMAKALGQALALRTEDDRAILCIDRIKISDGDYLDIGEPIGPALPVVIKTLVLSQ